MTWICIKTFFKRLIVNFPRPEVSFFNHHRVETKTIKGLRNQCESKDKEFIDGLRVRYGIKGGIPWQFLLKLLQFSNIIAIVFVLFLLFKQTQSFNKTSKEQHQR